MARFDETFWTSLGSLVPGEFVSTWIRHLHMSRRIPLATAVLVLIALLLRCTVSLNSYSGRTEGANALDGVISHRACR